jgi:hypothetical protein
LILAAFVATTQAADSLTWMEVQPTEWNASANTIVVGGARYSLGSPWMAKGDSVVQLPAPPVFQNGKLWVSTLQDFLGYTASEREGGEIVEFKFSKPVRADLFFNNGYALLRFENVALDSLQFDSLSARSQQIAGV